MDIYCKKAEIILLGDFGEEAPTLPSCSPTAIFDVLIEKPVLITTKFAMLPNTEIKVSLYLPGAPGENELAKTTFLSQKAKDKKCCLGSVMVLEDSHTLAGFADSYDSSAICNVAPKIATHLLSSLTYFSDINVMGDKSLQDLVAKTIKPAKKLSDKNVVPESDLLKDDVSQSLSLNEENMSSEE